MAEVLRTKANLLLATNRAACDLVEPILFSSLEISRRQRALAWELRASCDLASCGNVRDKTEERLSCCNPSTVNSQKALIRRIFVVPITC